MRGNCYATSEAVYHLLGGKAAGWKPMRVRHEADMHWWLQHEDGMRIDLTASQFSTPPPYEDGVGCGFLTKRPSKAAHALMMQMVWKEI